MTVVAHSSFSICTWGNLGILAASMLAGCSAGDLGSDALEIANISRANEVPKSSPAALVRAFDTFCVNRPATLSEADAKLRAASYVPVRNQLASRGRLYLVDDKRPAVAISQNLCLVQAGSRTGQTEKLRAYRAAKFPQARPMDPESFAENIENAWLIPGDTPSEQPAILASQRRLEPGNKSRYSLIYFQPAGKVKQ